MNCKATQPPSGGCELKHTQRGWQRDAISQPPSGGCELKLRTRHRGAVAGDNGAAIGRGVDFERTCLRVVALVTQGLLAWKAAIVRGR